MTEQQNLLKIAQAEIGTRETGDNITKYGADYGLTGTDWCCQFVWWCFHRAELSALFYNGKKTAYCPYVQNWAKADKLLVEPETARMGDIALFDWKDSGTGKRNGLANHIGIVEACKTGVLTTIDGNWSNAVSRVNRKFSGGDILAVVRPKWGQASRPTTPATVPKVGEKVRVKAEATVYYPQGAFIPKWVKEEQITVAQVLYNGKIVEKGGKQCILLGNGINTWCAVENLEVV
ncbi:MAG: CHAP domain-containing protein [Oscillospiraceae bacterium]|jgi:hypothetical protein|nr:CHAP domain-containing protein [Oscillospiraceae bacterium]